VSAGLDIGSGYVKLVVIDHSKPEPEITKVATRPLVSDAIVDGEIMDPVLVSETVRAVARSVGLNEARVGASVGGHDVIMRKIEMDRASEADTRALIRWEAEQHVPFDMESVQLDFQILDPDGDSPQMSVLLVAAKRELIENRMSLLADAGLSAAIIDVESFALHNAFGSNYPNMDSGLIALVNIGHETTNVNVLDDSVPVLVRDIPFGSRRLREALQRERGLTADQAEEVVQGRTNGNGQGADLRAFVAERAEELAIGIERAAAVVTAQSGGQGIGRVFLSGGAARVPGVVEAIGNRLGVRTEVANPVERVAVRSDVAETVALDDVAPMLMLSVGLALRRAR